MIGKIIKCSIQVRCYYSIEVQAEIRKKSIFTIRSPSCVSVRQLQNLAEPWFSRPHKRYYKDVCLPRSLWNINKTVYVKAPRPRPWCKVSLHECFCGCSNQNCNPFLRSSCRLSISHWSLLFGTKHSLVFSPTMPENLTIQEDVLCLRSGFGNTPPGTPAYHPSLALPLQDPLFCREKKSNRC